MRKPLLALLVSSLLGLTAGPITAAENLAALAKPVARGDQSSESIYFVMVDRFADGDTSNNQGGLTGSPSETGYDPTDWGYWHGGDFKGLTSKLSYIKNLGFTAIWITPPVKNAVLQSTSTGYHGYWGLDFLSIDPHLGTEADFKEFVASAHSLGMKVILDVVANHTADVINYRDGKAYIPAGREKEKNPNFLNELSNYHNAGNSTFDGESLLNGDFYGLDDLATEKPEVVKGFIDIWSYWINNFDIDGLRIDTFKHVNSEFWRQVIPAIQKVAKDKGKKSFPIFGEAADNSPTSTAPYIANGEVPSLLDFPFALQVSNFAAKGSPAKNLADLFNADDLYTTATTSAYGLATFISNHDSGRIGSTIVADIGENNSLAFERAKLAQSALFLLRGGPVAYYGDEKGMTGGGGDKSARQDMFATQVSRWTREDRIGSTPIGSESAFNINHPLETFISELQAVVRSNPALRSGTQQVRTADRHFFAVTRFSQGQEYVVAFNNDSAQLSGKVKVANASGAWSKISGDCQWSGKRELSLTFSNLSHCVLKAGTLISKSDTTKISAPKIESPEEAVPWRQVSVTTNGTGYNTVTFAARVKGGKWINLGSTDRKTMPGLNTVADRYRAYIRQAQFPKATTIEVVAIARTSTGKVLVSPITKGSLA